MALSEKSFCATLKRAVMTKVRNYCPVTVCNFNIAFRFPAGPGQGRRVRLPPATAALSNTHPVLTLWGDWPCCTPQDPELHPEHLTLPLMPWRVAGGCKPGWEGEKCLSVSVLPGSSLRHTEPYPLVIKIPHQDTLKAPSPSQQPGWLPRWCRREWILPLCLRDGQILTAQTGRRGAPPVNSPVWRSRATWASVRAKQPNTTQNRI